MMRRAIFCLLILLTALRGMVGDAMAVEMAHKQAFSDTQVSLSLEASAASLAEHPCHGSAASAPDHASHADPAAHDCVDCQVCHLPVLQRACAMPDLQASSSAYQPHIGAAWMSADLVLLQKPPLS